MNNRTVDKVIYILYKYMEPYEYDKYGIQIFEKYNIKVEVWSLPALFLKNPVPPEEVIKKDNVLVINEKEKILEKLLKINRKSTHLLLLLPYSNKNTYYFQVLLKIMGFHFSMLYTQILLIKGNVGSVKENYIKQKRKIWFSILNLFFDADYNFVSSPAAFYYFPSAYSIKKKNNILVHTLDYDNYLNLKDEKSNYYDKEYILFIDEDYVEHINFKLRLEQCPFSKPELYYKPMCKLFNMLEDMYHCEVVIAVHPRSHYKSSDVYGGRKMIKDKTAQLIKNAKIVVCHTTLAFDYIVLFKKPFILVYMDQIKKTKEWAEEYIPLINFMNIKALNTSMEYDKVKLKEYVNCVKSKNYTKYKERFIKRKGTEEKLYFEIVAEKILNRNVLERK